MVILGRFAPETFTLLVIASVAAAAVGRALMGDHPAFAVPPYQLRHPLELVFYYAALGLTAGLAGVLFTRLLYHAEDQFERIRRLPPYLLPVAGGLVVGVIGLAAPQVFGVGYETIAAALDDRLPWRLLLALFLAKLAATCITLGSGGSGGIFAPSLFMGTMLGGALGRLVQAVSPFAVGSPGAYALVGMGALVAATTQAPIQAILILFEMTQDYLIILPLMTSCVLAVLVASRLSRENIYTLKLARRGIHLRRGQDVDVLRETRVAEVMTRRVRAVHPWDTLSTVVRLMQETRHNGFPVVDEDGRAVGMITLEDVRDTHPEDPARRMRTTVGEAMSRDLLVAYPDESLEEVLDRFALRDVRRLPVVERGDGRRLVGLVTRRDVVAAYHRKLLQRPVPGPRATATPKPSPGQDELPELRESPPDSPQESPPPR